MDRIADLGARALGSRLRRLMQRLDRNVAQVYEQRSINFRPRWFPMVFLLGQHSPVSVTEAAHALGCTHTAIRKLSDELIGQNLIVESRDDADGRRRTFRLTPKGRRTVTSLTPIWEDIETAARQLLEESRPNLLEAISGIESHLDRREFLQRVNELRARRDGRLHAQTRGVK